MYRPRLPIDLKTIPCSSAQKGQYLNVAHAISHYFINPTFFRIIWLFLHIIAYYKGYYTV